MKFNYNKIDRDLRRDKVRKIVSFLVKNSHKFELQNYMPLSNKERLELIIEAIEKINPNYIAEFRKIEGKKPETRQVEIDDEFELKSVVESVDGLTVVEKALEIFYSNKVAHLCRTAQKNMISDLTEEENEKNIGYSSLMYRFSDEEMNRVTIFTHRYFVAKKSLNKKAENIAKRELEKNGIDQELLDILEERGYNVLSKTYLDCMAIKTEAIDESVELLKKIKLNLLVWRK